MAQDMTKALEEIGAPAREFWENDLVTFKSVRMC